MTTNYQAFWAPGLDSDLDPDEVLGIAFAWLRRAERESGESGVLVMNAASMRRNRPILATVPWDIVSRRSHRPRGGGPVLAVWPSASTLELAEQMAIRTSICVIPGTLFDLVPWIRRTKAACLVEGFDVPAAAAVPPDVTERLDQMLAYDGHNGFLGAGGKEYTIRTLREIARVGRPPTGEAIEEYLAGSGETSAEGAARAARWYEEVREGRRHVDYARRPI